MMAISTGGIITTIARTPMNQNCTPRVSMAPAMWTGTVMARLLPMRHGEQELVPGEGEDDEAGRGHRWCGERQRDPPEGAPMAGAVDQRRLLELDRQIEEGLAQDDHHEGQHEGGVDQDQREVRIEQARASAW